MSCGDDESNSLILRRCLFKFFTDQAYAGSTSTGAVTADYGTSVRGRSPPTLLSTTIPATLSSSTSVGDGSGATNSSSLWYTMTELATGEPYFVRVSASNARGLGLPRGSNPSYLAPPKQVPAKPEGVHIFPATSNSLRSGRKEGHSELTLVFECVDFP